MFYYISDEMNCLIVSYNTGDDFSVSPQNLVSFAALCLTRVTQALVKAEMLVWDFYIFDNYLFIK